jgi:hypothetical protein
MLQTANFGPQRDMSMHRSPMLVRLIDAAQPAPEPSPYNVEAGMSSNQLLNRWDSIITEASQRFHIPAAWIRAVMRQESGGRTMLGDGVPMVSRAGAVGLMQVLPATYGEMAAQYRLGDNPFEPRDNIMAGTAYLRWLQHKYGYPAMFAAYNAKKFQDAIGAADKILDRAYVNVEAHGLESMAYRSLADTAKADFHKEIFQGLVNSIVVGKDGKTSETAFVVISTQEEYVVMRALGYTVGSQALLSERGHKFDVLSGTDQKTNQPVKIYFNIDIPWAAETRVFGSN